MKIFSFIFAITLFWVLYGNAADTKISELTALLEGSIASDDEMVIVDTSATATKRITFTEFDKRYATKDVASGNILVGNASGAATSVDPSGDIDVTNAGVFSIGTGAIVNADVSTGAAIAHSKLAAMTSGYVLVGSAATVPTAVAISGDIGLSNAGVASISTGVILNADVSTGAAITFSKMAALTADRVVYSNASGEIVVGAASSTELGYLDGVTSAIQTQIDTKGAKASAADGIQHMGLARATYDFSEHGGTAGDISLGVQIPDNSKIYFCMMEITTAMASSGGSGTIAIKAEGANDILNAVDADSLGTGFKACIPNWAAANVKKTTAARNITATIGSEDLTAGVFIVDCLYSIGD
jgi:hypothetical protein